MLNTITPATDSTCMYFWSLVRNYRLSDQALTTQLREANAKIFGEDQVVVEAQRRVIDQNPDLALKNLNIDAGAAYARRVTSDMIAKEPVTAVTG